MIEIDDRDKPDPGKAPRAAGPEPEISRHSTAPAYYLGRPARLWITVMRPRRRRTTSDHPVQAVTGGGKQAHHGTAAGRKKRSPLIPARFSPAPRDAARQGPMRDDLAGVVHQAVEPPTSRYGPAGRRDAGPAGQRALRVRVRRMGQFPVTGTMCAGPGSMTRSRPVTSAGTSPAEVTDTGARLRAGRPVLAARIPPFAGPGMHAHDARADIRRRSDGRSNRPVLRELRAPPTMCPLPCTRRECARRLRQGADYEAQRGPSTSDERIADSVLSWSCGREEVAERRKPCYASSPFMKTRQAAGKAVPLAAATARQFPPRCRRWLSLLACAEGCGYAE